MPNLVSVPWFGMVLVDDPVGTVEICQLQRLDDQQVFGIGGFGCFGEIEAPRDHGGAINHHHFVVGDSVGSVDPDGDSGSDQVAFHAGAPGFVALVEDDSDVNATVMGGLESLGDGDTGEAIGLNKKGLPGCLDDGNHLSGTASAWAEKDMGWSMLQN